MRSYSRETNTQCYRLIQERSVSTRINEGRARYLIEITSYIDTDTNLRMRFEQIAVVFKIIAPKR